MSKTCKFCGNKLEKNAKFCTECGRMVEKSIPIYIIIIIIAVIAAAVTAAFIIIHHFTGDDDNLVDQDSSRAITEMEKESSTVEVISSYTVYKDDITWYDADSAARSMGGTLVCINDAEEFYKVCSLADKKNLKVCWVGASRSYDQLWEDVYWNDGTPITFKKWYDSDPSYYYDGQDELYLMIFKVGDSWYFNDAANDISDPEYKYLGKIGYIVETIE